MNNKLLEMKKELGAILNGDPVLKKAMREVNKMDIIRGCMIARSGKHQEMKIDSILDGELVRDISIGDYMFMQNAMEMAGIVYNNLEMGNSVDRHLLTAAYRILSEDPEGSFRTDNPVVYGFNHVPPHASDVDSKLAEAFRKVYGAGPEVDAAACAMYLHNAIIEIWPFDEFNNELAIFGANYYLMEQGLMPIDMPIDRQDYLELVAAALKGRKIKEEYMFFSKAILEKMAGTIEACRGYVK